MAAPRLGLRRRAFLLLLMLCLSAASRSSVPVPLPHPKPEPSAAEQLPRSSTQTRQRLPVCPSKEPSLLQAPATSKTTSGIASIMAISSDRLREMRRRTHYGRSGNRPALSHRTAGLHPRGCSRAAIGHDDHRQSRAQRPPYVDVPFCAAFQSMGKRGERTYYCAGNGRTAQHYPNRDSVSLPKPRWDGGKQSQRTRAWQCIGHCEF